MNLPSSLASASGLATVKYISRILFLSLVLVYFFHTPASVIEHPSWLIWLVGAAYAIVQAAVLWLPAKKNEPLAALIDFLAFTSIIVLDPGTPPPTLVLLLVAIFSAGLIYGIRRQLLILAGSTLVLAIALPLRMQLQEEQLTGSNSLATDIPTLFLLSAIAFCALYALVLSYRNQVLRKQAEAATWQDPQTLLLSRAALISTAGWLVPLHDRISAPLSIVVLQATDNSDTISLANLLMNRIRRSDVAARASEDMIALLLPHTDRTAAEQLLQELRHIDPAFVAALATSANDTPLEQLLTQLATTLGRAENTDEHWLVHTSN